MNDRSKEILVAKFGSSSIANSEGVNSNQIADSVSQLADLSSRFKIVVVHSGSVALGKSFAIKTVGREAEAKMNDSERASAGSARISAEFQDWFAESGILAGQVLLTHREIEDMKAGPAISERLSWQLNKGMVPLINENDIVSESELKLLAYGGDNDGLSSHVARAIDADKLLLLTDKGGFEVGGEVVPRVSYGADSDLIVDNIGKGSELGTGGMFTKIEAAAKFVRGRVRREAYIGSVATNYGAILAGEAGTRVVQ